MATLRSGPNYDYRKPMHLHGASLVGKEGGGVGGAKLLIELKFCIKRIFLMRIIILICFVISGIGIGRAPKI